LGHLGQESYKISSNVNTSQLGIYLHFIVIKCNSTCFIDAFLNADSSVFSDAGKFLYFSTSFRRLFLQTYCCKRVQSHSAANCFV